MRLLLVEDNKFMAQMIAALLVKKDFNVTTVHTKQDALDNMRSFQFDAVLLDLRLNDDSGLDVLAAAREMGIEYPILILSGDMETDTKVDALRAGADDYVTKPFKIEELQARILAVVRRVNGHVSPSIEIGPMRLELEHKQVHIHGNSLNLTRKEYEILEALVLRSGRTLSKDTLLSLLYGGMDEPSPKIIDVFVCKLRKKLADALNGDSPIQTVYGVGYAFKM
jgi:two-component system, cell cycle response regulator CtrA